MLTMETLVSNTLEGAEPWVAYERSSGLGIVLARFEGPWARNAGGEGAVSPQWLTDLKAFARNFVAAHVDAVLTSTHFDYHHELAKLPIDGRVAKAQDIVCEE